MELNYIIKETDNYTTVNDVLINEFQLSSRLLVKLIKNQKIFLNNEIIDTRSKVKPFDSICADLNMEEDNSNIVPRQMDLEIIYEDEWILVLNKPSGIAIHPSILHYDDSLSNGVRFYFDSIGLKKKIRPVNRLDSNTSGLVIFAKCEYIGQALSLQMQNGTFEKFYLALAEGIFDKKASTINLPIARKENSIIERCIDFENGQKSITHYKVLDENIDKNFSLIECKLETGRTHQIRVHFSFIGHPLVGDSLYGSPSDLIDGQALHCSKLKFVHPVFKNDIVLLLDLPTNIKKLLV